MVDMRFLYELELPHRAVAVYQYLFFRADREGQCWPAVPTIANALRISEKTVRRAIKDLEAKGLLTTEQRYRRSGAKSSLMFQLKHP